MPHSRAELALVAERRRGLARLRRRGIRFDDPRILDLGYTSAASARRDMNRTLKQNLKNEAIEVASYRQLENERLDELLEALWPSATKPQPILDKEGEVIGESIDVRAVDSVLRLLDRRAKLNGLDMPVKAEVTGANGGPLQLSQASTAELEALIGLSPEPNAVDGDFDDLSDEDDDYREDDQDVSDENQ